MKIRLIKLNVAIHKLDKIINNRNGIKKGKLCRFS